MMKPRFDNDTGFYRELKSRVDAYFETTGVARSDSPRMYAKTAFILGWFVSSYVLLVFASSTWWQGALLSASLALSLAAIGFNVQHDANHGAYSSRPFVNRLLGSSLDVLGASSYVWRWKHNIFHHTYTNLDGTDDDIHVGPLARLAPAQRRYRVHRVQQFYMWLLYGFLLAKWQFVDDFRNVVSGRIAGNLLPRPRRWHLFELIAGKVVFLSWAFVLPALFHPWWVVLVFYAGTAFLVGVILSVVFQVAHCGQGSSFPVVNAETGRVESAWAAHQVETTVNFAPRNRLLTWYLGGLNFQIEHHLFPKICHLHYPHIAPIVRTTCEDFGVRYTVYRGMTQAVVSHWRWLRDMGRPVA